MIALTFDNPRRLLGAPKNWDHSKDGICHTLEILDHDGWMISAWQPTEEELKRINEGHPIFLLIKGTTHPVVALSVGTKE